MDNGEKEGYREVETVLSQNLLASGNSAHGEDFSLAERLGSVPNSPDIEGGTTVLGLNRFQFVRLMIRGGYCSPVSVLVLRLLNEGLRSG
ncbi:autophagy-related protein 18 [Pseudozyma hubeiensis SY62]|uniref:Autophagy-related protein 18 n=1 Tax=Pseudozyma hubeiensis (strain SY62) TaxID=1305764 RepID=R9P6Q8_PSEHS|nr:autophagy-related protein 18 [Pseudozyma hubeiensis SY62]GAC97093.1 autophagy-related protein 18 [Pseudozyma hubeiensis SY62]